MLNAVLNAHADRVFFGGGLGYSTKEHEGRKSGVDLVGQIGVDVLQKRPDMTGSIFAELRAPIITSNRSFSDHHKILLGFRLTF